MEGRAFVFINHVQAARLGHVGWGFTLDHELASCYFGSTDHLISHRWFDLAGWLRYAHLPERTDNHWWGETASRAEMFRIMRAGHHIRYHEAKEIPVVNADPSAARLAAESLREAGWSVLANNCVHQTYKVLSAYGAQLPLPSPPAGNLIPRLWFKRLAGAAVGWGLD